LIRAIQTEALICLAVADYIFLGENSQLPSPCSAPYQSSRSDHQLAVQYAPDAFSALSTTSLS